MLVEFYKMAKEELMEFFALEKDGETDEGSEEVEKELPKISLRRRWASKINAQIPRLSQGLKAYTLIGFYAIFFVAVCFTTNVLMDLILGMINPVGDLEYLWQWILFRVTTVVIILGVIIDSCFLLTLVWQVIQPFHKESRVWYFWMKVVFLVIDVVFGVIVFSAIDSDSGFTGFVEYLLLVSFTKAGVLSLIGSLFLVRFVYTKRNKKIFPKDKRPWLKMLVFWGILFMLCAMHVCPVMYLISGSSLLSIGWAVFVPFTSCIVLTFVYCRGSRKETSGFLWSRIVIIIMILAFCIVMGVFFAADYQCDESCQLKLPPHSSQGARGFQAITENPSVPGYQICTKKWGSLTITDMVFFADLAYKTGGTDKNLTDILDNYFKYSRSSRWTVELVNRYKPSFYHIRNNWANGVNIVGIRGTTDFRDWVENAKIWNEVLIYQMFFSLVPLSSVIPTNVVAHYIKRASIMDYVYAPPKSKDYKFPPKHKSYIDLIENYLEGPLNSQRRRREEFYLVGHSLGGGLAKIIGSRLKIQAVAISSPGDIYIHKKYSYTLEDLEKYTTSFGARDDVISKIDKPGGLVQTVKKENSSSLWEVHSIKNTYCDIKKKCAIYTPIPCKK